MNTKTSGVVERVAKHVNMGHRKRNECVLRHVMRLAGAPGAGAGQAAGSKDASWAESKSWYDLINNEKVGVRTLRELRARVVREGFDPSVEVAVFHDITELDFTCHGSKRERMEIGDDKGRGYEYHPCVAWDPRAKRFLGVLHDTVISQTGPDDADMMDYHGDPLLAHWDEAERNKLLSNHRHQLATHIRGLAALAPGQPMVHVADREFDDIPAMAAARQVNHDFVFRVLGNRSVRVEDNNGQMVTCAMHVLIAALPMTPYKEVGLDARGHVAYGGGKPKRMARLSIGACRVFLYRPATRGERRDVKLSAPLAVNLVVIRELDPPPGVNALCWLLFTSLPVDTFEQQAWAGALYEQRWRIEEYFKLLKSGFRIESSHFVEPGQIAKALVFYSLAAMALLLLKTELDIAPTGPLDKDRYAKIRHAMRHPDDPELDPSMQLFALVLRGGGWLGRRTDPIGPAVLMRGMLQVMTMFSMVNQFSDLIGSLAKNYAGAR
jgi:Transposase DDE domain